MTEDKKITIDYSPHRIHGIKVSESGNGINFITNLRRDIDGGYKYLKSTDDTTHFVIIPTVKSVVAIFNIFNRLRNETTIKMTIEFLDEAQHIFSESAGIIGGMIKNSEIDINNPPVFDAKIPLRKHQNYGVAWMLNLTQHGLLWEMRTGKTATVIIGMKIKMERGDIDRVFVVVPRTIMRNWQKEINKFSDCTSTIIRGTIKQKANLLREAETNHTQFIITNFEAIPSLMIYDEFNFLMDRRTALWVDETSKIKNPEAKRTKALIRLSNFVKDKGIMTGTLITLHEADVWSQYAVCTRLNMFGPSYDAFKYKHFYTYNGKLLPKHQASDKISDKVYTISTRILQKECMEIPNIEWQEREVILGGTQNKMYVDMLEKCIAEIEDMGSVATASVIVTKLLRLSQITAGHIKDVDGNVNYIKGNAKLLALKELMEELPETPFLIWSRFIADFKVIRELCESIGRSVVEIHGGVKDDIERMENADAFHDGKVDTFIGNPQSAGYGLNLSPIKDGVVVYFTNSFAYGDRKQSEDRIIEDRDGEKYNITCIDLMAKYTRKVSDSEEDEKNTIDYLIKKALKHKQSVGDVISRDTIRDLLDLKD